MKEEPDIAKELREAEKLGLLQSMIQSTFEELEVPDEPIEKTSDQTSRMIRDREKRTNEREPGSVEEKYRTIFENYAVAMTLADNKERIVSWNKYAEELFNMTQNELYLKSVSSLYPPEEWQKIRAENVRQKGIKYRMETRMIRKNQGLFDVELSLCVLRGKEGKIVGSIGIIKDITRLKETEKELKTSEERYRTIFENSAVALTVTDENERIISWNKCTEDLLSVGKEDLYLKPVESLYPVEEWQKIRSQNIRQKGLQHHLETKMFKKNNEIIDVDLSLSVLKNHEGRVIGSIGVTRDITERKQIEKTLEASEEKFKQLYEKAPVPYHTISLGGEITSVNEKWCRTLGYEKEEVISRSIFDFVAEKEREIAKSSFKEKIRCKKPYMGGHERTFVTKDGVEKIFVIHDFLLSDKGKNAISVHTTMEDVTERKMIEERTRQETEDMALINSLNNTVNQGKSLLEIFRLLEDETRRIFSSNGAAVYLLSPDKKELVLQLTSHPKKLLNKVKKLTGLKIPTPRIVLNKDNIYTKILVDKKPRLINSAKDIKKMMAGCTEKRMRKTFISRIYSLLDIHSVISVPLVSFDEVVGLLDISCKEPFSESDVYRMGPIAEQITAIVKKKMTDDMLKESEDRYRDLFENVKDLIQSVNAEGKFVYVNRSWLQTLGYSKDEVKDLNLSDIIRKDYMPHCMEVFKRVCAGETVNNMESVFVAKDGQEIYVEGNANAHFHDGKFIATRGIFRDITLRKQAEEQLKQLNQNLELKVQERTAEVEKLLQQKDAFINQLNHDLRTPLTPLVNLIPLLEKIEKDPKSKELFGILRNSINRMKNIVNKTLKLAELNAPSTMFDMKDINLWEEAEKSIKDQQLICDKEKFTVKNKVDENIFIKADKLRLSEVFGNLISNAVKYSPLGGTITVDAHDNGDFVTVSIMDSGIGITAEQIDHIFEEFYKADESRHDLESSGLGLSICKRIVEKHGGRIWVDSPGKGMGSTFYFTLKVGEK